MTNYTEKKEKNKRTAIPWNKMQTGMNVICTNVKKNIYIEKTT